MTAVTSERDRLRPIPGGDRSPMRKSFMTIENQTEHLYRPQVDGAHHPTAAKQSDNNSEAPFSAIGLLCNGLLTAVNDIPGCADSVRYAIGVQVSNIFSMYAEAEGRTRAASKKISELKRNLRRVTEQLAVLRQEHFDKSSEKIVAGNADDDLDFAHEADFGEAPKPAPKGKRARETGSDVEAVRVHHYPSDMTCCSCGHDLQSIKAEERVGTFRIVPEHVVLVKNVYHTCACNRGACKDNKPVSAKSQSHIMKGRGMEPEFAAEVAIQKFFEHLPTFRMERRLHSANVNLSRQAIEDNVAHLASHLEPIVDQLSIHAMAGHSAHMDETPVRVQAPGKGKCDKGYFWVICRDERPWNFAAQPAVAFHYNPSRKGEVAEDLLSGTALRFLQTDGYSGDNRLFPVGEGNDTLVSARCWAHARRKFFETWIATKSNLANWVVQMIR